MKKKINKTKKKASKRETSTEDDAVVEEDTVDGHEIPKKRGRPSAVPYKDFVRVWSESTSVDDVVQHFAIAKTSATAIAGRLRRAGVSLKKFPRRGAQAIDVKELNRIAAGKAD